MAQAENTDLRTLIRDLAMRRESHDRRQLYWALIVAKVWTPVRVDSPVSDISPADLHPLDREALGGLASFAVFTHPEAAKQWQVDEKVDVPLRLEHIGLTDFLSIVLDAGAGSLYLNPGSKYTGELYRHELETCLDGARKLARREKMMCSAEPQDASLASQPELLQPESTSLWARLMAWIQ